MKKLFTILVVTFYIQEASAQPKTNGPILDLVGYRIENRIKAIDSICKSLVQKANDRPVTRGDTTIYHYATEDYSLIKTDVIEQDSSLSIKYTIATKDSQLYVIHLPSKDNIGLLVTVTDNEDASDVKAFNFHGRGVLNSYFYYEIDLGSEIDITFFMDHIEDLENMLEDK
jgi:hypothetical protein